MIELQAGDQTILYDRGATEEIYLAIEHGDPEGCGCVFCRNFVLQRDRVYPASFKALLAQIGIDASKEIEVFEYGPVEDGCRLYGGWLYFVGELVRAGEQNQSAPDAHEFTFFFTRAGPRATAFQGVPHLGIEFTAHVKWILPESPDTGRH